MTLREQSLRWNLPKYTSPDSIRSSGASAVAVLLGCMSTLTPSFLRWEKSEPRKLHSTSYLDGLRGVAALFVVFNHYVAQYFQYLTHGYRSSDNSEAEGERYDRWVQLPIIRAFYDGRFMVAIFFVISGYVLSYKTLRLSRQRDFASLLKSLSSSVLRRWLRLMLPSLTSLFIGFLLARCGFGAPLYEGWDISSGPATDELFNAARLPTPEEATMVSWVIDAWKVADPFRFGRIEFPQYDFPLWTMSVEYTGSMIVFVIVMAISLVRPAFQLFILTFLTFYCFCTGNWHWTLFISGILLADLSQRRLLEPESIPSLASRIDEDEDEEEGGDNTEKPQRQSHWTLFRKAASYSLDLLLFLLAIYVGSAPIGPEDPTPGSKWLWEIIPKKIWGLYSGFFYPVIAGILLVSVLEHGKFLQQIFTTRTAQYLGDISVSIYVLHALVIMTLGDWLVPICLVAAKGAGSWDFTVGMSVALSCCAFVTFWISDVFWRVIDVRSVNFTKWVSLQILADDV